MLYEKNNRENIFCLSHLSAGMANVPVYSKFMLDSLTYDIKTLDTNDKCIQIEKMGTEAEITDYAILQGGEYWEAENNDKTEVKRYGSYWTTTDVEIEKTLPVISELKDVNIYHVKKVETCYTFYGYEKGEKCEEIIDPCIVEFVYKDGTMLFLNEKGNLFNLSKDWSYYYEANIARSMSPAAYIPTPKIYFYSKGICIGTTDKIVAKTITMKKLADGKYKYVGGRNYSNIVEVSDCKIGVRPVINSYNYAAIDVKPQDEIKLVSFTDFPQTAVSSNMQTILEQLYEKGNLNITGKSYPTSSVKRAIEYEFNGKKYVRVTAKLCKENKSVKLSNGCKYNNGDIVWVLVEPISLLVDENNMTSICEKIIFAGVPYNETFKINTTLLDNAEQYMFSNQYDFNSKIISGTEWMRLYRRMKDRYEEENIPFEETEKQAAERYIKEYKQLKQYCDNNKQSMAFSRYDLYSTFKRISYSYRPSVKFLNSIEDPEVAILAALGPKDIWICSYYKEYLKAYGAWAFKILKEENIKSMAGQIYDEKLEKIMVKIRKLTSSK